MNRLIVPTLFACLLGGSTALADDGPMAEPASRAWAVTDAVLAHHVDPPARQEMLLAGVKAMALATRGALPDGLARRVSDLSGPDQLAALLDEILTSPKVAGDPTKPRLLPLPDGLTPGEVFLNGVVSAIPGGATLLPEKERKVRESFAANLYVGIQIHLGVDEKSKRPVFLKILEGGPADNAGAKAGDLIEEVDGESTAEKPLSWVVDRLREGREGTDVLVQLPTPRKRRGFHEADDPGDAPEDDRPGAHPPARQALGGPARRPGADRLPGSSPSVSGSTPQELRGFAASSSNPKGAKPWSSTSARLLQPTSTRRSTWPTLCTTAGSTAGTGRPTARRPTEPSQTPCSATGRWSSSPPGMPTPRSPGFATCPPRQPSGHGSSASRLCAARQPSARPSTSPVASGRSRSPPAGSREATAGRSCSARWKV